MRKSRFAAQLLRTTIMTGAAFAVALPALAQDDEADDDRIVVTGTRVQNANLVASSPITSIDAEELTLAGTTRVEDLLNTYPQLAPSFDSFTVNPTTGFATADLRGLGSQRTLVLVNGHRLPPGGIRSEARDLNSIPAALVERIEVLTGGASAVYGSDAMAGVINFILDSDFEGFSLRTGVSGTSHKNDNEYMQGLLDARGFTYPEGDSGIDGKAYNVDVAVGSQFADGAGHAMAYFTWRHNQELLQGSRDYSSCALSASGRSCGGSATSPNPNFYISGIGGWAHIDPTTGLWVDDGGVPGGAGGVNLYNFAPVNHYQRPDDRWTFGGSLHYEVAPHFRPYIEAMFANTNTKAQIAESGTFFVDRLTIDCATPTTHEDSIEAGIAAMCSQLGIGASTGVYVGKRNVEGGPRISSIEASNFRVVTGAEGEIGTGWTYNASFLYGRNHSNEANENDFLIDRTSSGLLGCPAGSFSGCLPYNVWELNSVTPESAAALGGAGLRQGSTSMLVINGYVSGDTGIVSPFATDAIALVGGVEWRKETYTVKTDANMQSGNFTGLGGPRLPVTGSYSVTEFFLEAGVPLIENQGFLQSFALDLGYRYSNYSTSGGVHTYKAGASAQLGDYVRVRGGFNRAIRAPGVGELFRDQQIALFGGNDPCAGAAPLLTLAQCMNTGVTAGQYGSISASPAAQYNQFIGGNVNLVPETADTWTVGFVATPMDRLQVSIDYYDIYIKDRIGVIGANTILNFCATLGDPFLCSKVNRASPSGDLWRGSDPATSGFVENLNDNFGNIHFTGVDLTGSYSYDAFGGTFTASGVVSYYIKQFNEPLPGINPAANFDCAGVINVACQQPNWRSTMRVGYSQDWISGSVRWRRTGGMDYINQDGTPGTGDDIVEIDHGGRLPSWNFIDLQMGFDVHENASLTIGMNNILDKEPPLVGSTLTLNANAPGGYDQLGRYLFATLDLRF